MYGFGGVGLSEVQISISELSVVGGGWVGGGGGGWTRQTHFMVGPSQGPTKNTFGHQKGLEVGFLTLGEVRKRAYFQKAPCPRF